MTTKPGFRSAAALLAAVAVLMCMSGAPISADGAPVEHETFGDELGFRLPNPAAGEFYFFDFASSPGDWCRTNPDGTTTVHREAEAAVFSLNPSAGFTVPSYGEGFVTLTSSAICNPDGSFRLTFRRVNVHATLFLIDTETDEEFVLIVQAIVRNGRIMKLDYKRI